ncbi:MAG: prephenate/arogenate dehydrogenase family protein [Alphaproteobacteria bacterium]|nr:prephenate/arogenate dehydrogenase family protein [Alphaproteobacteria bacterium]NCQ87832.1 prephenate/arogenate dehydrogenase family protein [Alphaproteobacteria bacterium]NCT05660.1 prephenate/arogenate dehydrogenase family protein [Alphaproteobacteria bacterium]
MFKQITIIGFGLIGSSIARGIRKHNLAEKIICGDISQEVCNKVAFLKLADAAIADLAIATKGSDLVIICTPAGKMGEVVQKIVPCLKEGAIVTDVGSVKKQVVKQIQPHIPKGVHFVPGHPIAGTEFSGPEHGFAELFEGRWCILTPLDHTELKAVEKMTHFWEALGSNIEIMEAGHHDLVLGITSHLPHLIAYTIVGTANDLEDDIKSEVIKFSASGFRDFTRIAASDPTMWRDVFLNNKEAVLEMLQRFTEDLTDLQKAIRKQDGDYLYQRFKETRDIRKAIVDAGQADPENMKLIKN